MPCPTLVDFRLILCWKHAPLQAHLVLDNSVNVFAAQDLVDTFESPSTETNGNGDTQELIRVGLDEVIEG